MKSENRLVRQTFLIFLATVSVIFVAVYLFSVPLIKSQVFEIERNSARLALNNVIELAGKMYSHVQSYEEQLIRSKRQQLKAVIDLVSLQVDQRIGEKQAQQNNYSQSRQALFEEIQKIASRSDGYLWIVDQNASLLNLQDYSLNETVTESKTEQVGEAAFRTLIETTIREGEGYLQQTVIRKENDSVEKLTYARSFPQLGFVIGTDLYLEDLELEVESKKRQALLELRAALSKIKVAKTGYLFVFDKDANMLYHPNNNVDRKNFLTLIDPSSGRPIFDELIAVSDTGKELNYKWDSPTDSGNYVYDKMALVRSLEGLGWYVGSSVYLEELRSSAAILAQRILIVAFVSIMVSLIAAAFLINRIFRPIKQLVKTAEKINTGDLSAKSEIDSNDEIGVLANAFDNMVNHLKNNIETLDQTVKLRTQALAELEERQRLILDALPAQVAYLNKELEYVFVNKRYAEIFRLKKEEAIGKRIREVIGDEMMDSITEEFDRCLAGETVVYEYQFYQDDKEIITKRTLLPDFNAEGEIVGILNLSLDITAEKEAELKLTEAHRINVAGQLAGGLAHDFNNLLSIILGNLQILRDRYNQQGFIEKHIEPAIRASLRGADITERLLTFSRHQNLTPVISSPDQLIQDVVQLVKSAIPEGIHLTFTNTAQKAIFVDPAQMENALVNLILNARDSIQSSGDITILINDRMVNSPLEFDEKVPSGEYVQIVVKDTGAGFSQEALTKAWEPFFTTKSHGKGTGLGLSMVFGFIKQSRGYISISNEKDAGAVITILLPASVEPAKIINVDTPVKEASVAANTENQLFLLVEDNDDVRKVIRENLVNIGFTVIEASDADEAETLITSIDDIHGLVSDINMPGRLNGFGLAALMEKRFPNSRIVLLTGYYDQLAVGHQDRWCIIRKPFNREALIQALTESSQGVTRALRG